MTTSGGKPAPSYRANYAADLFILVLGALAAVGLTVHAVTAGVGSVGEWVESGLLGWGFVAAAAALLALRFLLERRAGLGVGADERFRWIDDPSGEAAHEALVVRVLPRWGRALRPLAYGLVAAAWVLWVLV